MSSLKHPAVSLRRPTATWITVTALVLAGSNAVAQDVEFQSGRVTITGYLARPSPATGSNAPAVIVIHDDQGLTDAVKDAARLFAEEGFVALAPDLVSRLGDAPASGPPSGFGRRPAPIGPLSTSDTVQDTVAAFAFLEAHDGVDPSRISVVGLGWGGWRAFKLAELTPTLHRAVVFYGTTSDDRYLHRIQAPVLGHYAEYDFQTTAQVLATKRRMGDRFSYHVYPDMDRGFFGGGSGAIDYVALIRGREAEAAPATVDAASAQVAEAIRLAWSRTLEFLR